MISKNYISKINPRNKVYADKVRELAKKYSILGIVDVQGLPAPQFQKIRASLKGKAEVLIVKKNIVELVLEELDNIYPNVGELSKHLDGIIGLVFTNQNPFSLYKSVKKSKSPAPAKAGQVAPKDIIVTAGPTNFAPGPIIGELGAFKIKAGINAGKVEIKEDAVVAKEGEIINDKLAGILSRLGIEPMEVGLNIKAVYEDKTIYERKILDVDEESILNNLKTFANDAFKLAIGIDYYTKENITYFLGNAAKDSLGLGIGIAYPAAQTIKSLLLKANAQAGGVAMTLPQEVRPAGVVVIAAPVATVQSAVANEEPKKKHDEQPADAGANFGSFF